MKEAYPLCWPDGYKRTAPEYRFNSKFKQGMDTAQRFLRMEVQRIGGSDLIVSTNLPVRNDGGLYTDWMKRKIDDPGVAIYFQYKKKSISMCCDQYRSVWENIYALGKGIEALRGMERWGVSDFLERAFTGFTALPSSAVIIQRDIWEVLGLDAKPAKFDDVKNAYRKKSFEVHPDKGGSAAAFQELNSAYNLATQYYK